MSNFFNSGIKNVYILTQYHAYSLNKHIRDSWSKWTGLDEFFDAISHYLRFVEASDADYVAIFGGDHIYKMDIRQMIEFHQQNEADITIAALEVPRDEARRFGVFSVDTQGRITDFAEKPSSPTPIPGKDTCLCSMGNYIFSREKLIGIVRQGKRLYSDLDFGKHVIPMMLAHSDRIFAYNFNENVVPDMQPQRNNFV